MIIITSWDNYQLYLGHIIVKTVIKIAPYSSKVKKSIFRSSYEKI